MGGGGGGCANPKKNIEHMFLVKKKMSCRILKKEKKIEQPYKPGRGKGFCVMRDGPKSSCESHDTGLGITVKNECKMGLTGLHDSPARV